MDISEEQIKVAQLVHVLWLPTVLPALRGLQRLRLSWNSGLTASMQLPSLELNAFSSGVWSSLLRMKVIRWKISDAYIPSRTIYFNMRPDL